MIQISLWTNIIDFIWLQKECIQSYGYATGLKITLKPVLLDAISVKKKKCKPLKKSSETPVSSIIFLFLSHL